MEILEFTDYKNYLRDRLGQKGRRSGLKAQLAKAIGSHTAYVSKIMYQDANLSLEQGVLVNRFLGHNSEEAHYFLLLIQLARSGTSDLRQHFADQLDVIREKHLTISKRVGKPQEVGPEHHTVLYSRWEYGAALAGVNAPRLRTVEALSEELGLSSSQMKRILNSLVEMRLLQKTGSAFAGGPLHLHAGKDHPGMVTYHCQWRQKAQDAILLGDATGLHYTAVAALSAADAYQIKNKMIDQIDGHVRRIKNSPPEELYAFNLDFFPIAPPAIGLNRPTHVNY